MALPQIWRHMPGKALLALINLMSAVALIFEGAVITITQFLHR